MHIQFCIYVNDVGNNYAGDESFDVYFSGLNAFDGILRIHSYRSLQFEVLFPF